MVRSALLIGSLVAAPFALAPRACAATGHDAEIAKGNPAYTKTTTSDAGGGYTERTYYEENGVKKLVEVQKFYKGRKKKDGANYTWNTYAGPNGSTNNYTTTVTDTTSTEVKEVIDKDGNTTTTTKVFTYDLKIREWVQQSDDTTYKRKPATTSMRTDTGGGPLFRTGEVQLLAFGIGGTGHGVRNEDVPGTGTPATTRTTTVDNPNGPGNITVTTMVPATAGRTRNAAPIQGAFGGAGAELQVFVTPHLALGVEGAWMEDRTIGTVMGTVTARFPKGSNAPYLFAGGGVQFDGRTQAVGKIGGGIEHRFSPSKGIFADAAWMFSEHENAAVFRAGMSFAFGPGEPPASPSYKK